MNIVPLKKIYENKEWSCYFGSTKQRTQKEARRFQRTVSGAGCCYSDLRNHTGQGNRSYLQDTSRKRHRRSGNGLFLGGVRAVFAGIYTFRSRISLRACEAGRRKHRHGPVQGRTQSSPRCPACFSCDRYLGICCHGGRRIHLYQLCRQGFDL